MCSDITADRYRLAEVADEQAALRRIATLVARGVPAPQIFDAVAEEVGLRLGLEVVAVHRFGPEGEACIVGGWARFGDPTPVGRRFELDGDSGTASVYRTGQPARFDNYEHASGSIAAEARRLGLGSGVASPIIVNGRLWGSMAAGASRADALPADAESRLAAFTELLSTAISNVQARAEVERLADEQAALRRVATLVAKVAKPDEVFSAVAQEVAQVFDVELVTVCRYEPNDILVLSSVGIPAFRAGSRWSLDVPSLPGSIYQGGGPTRIDDFSSASGLDAIARDAGVKSAVGVPIVVDGSVWGSINVATTADERVPADAEERLSRFTDLVATSVSNTTMRAALAASRARVIAAADDTRRRIQRDLHDGAQQRLVNLILELRFAADRDTAGPDELRDGLAHAAHTAEVALDEVREISRGIHPAVLSQGGLSPALRQLTRRTALPIQLENSAPGRFPEHVEVAAYYIISELLTNASKHANATHAWVSLRVVEDTLHLSIRDDGVGGADPTRGSGLIGLRDRVEALGGTIDIESPRGNGTRTDVNIPVP